jgi:Kef-type K+ transport system membrane component KefB
VSLLLASDYYVLLEVFIFLAVAQLIRSVARRAGFPEIVADLIAGMVIGSYALGGVIDSVFGTQLFQLSAGVLLFADLAVVLLLFSSGLDGGFISLRRAGLPAVGAAIAGDVVPFVIAVVVFSHFYSIDTSLLLGVAVAPTSAAVAAALIRGEKLGNNRGAQFLMNAAALDDVVALVMLSVVLAIVGGQTDPWKLTGTVVTFVIAWVVLLLAAVVLVPRVLKLKVMRENDSVPFALLFGLIAVVLALGFSPVIGAFIAGLAIAESVVADRTREITAMLVAVFGSLFFIVVGAEFDVNLLRDPVLLGTAVALASLAAFGKAAGVYPFALYRLRDRRAARAVATGMISIGEIGLLVGALGLSDGLFTPELFGAVVLMAILTTLFGALLFPRAARAFRELPAVG